MNDVLQSEELKAIYFRYQDAVLLDNGEIHASDLNSEAIKEIIGVYNENRNMIPELHGCRPKVLKKPVAEVTTLISKTSTNQNKMDFVDKATLSRTAESVRDVLQQSVLKGISDIHFEIYRDRTEINIRVDGRLIAFQKPIPEKEYGLLFAGYVFNEAVTKKFDFSENKANDGRLEMELDTPDGRRNCSFRLAYVYADGGGQLTLRWLNKDLSIPTIDELGWEEGQVTAFKDFCDSASGICLITGQVGSGKTTTLAAALSSLKGKGRAINTIEDPVEINIGVMQTSINNTGEGDGIVDVAKYLLRHDPDIEMHGEVRETEGAKTVCRKGETGQLMFSTLHTSSNIGIASTLIDQMGVPESLVAMPNLMRLWIYQTLVRKVCPHCGLSHDEALEIMSERDKSRLDIWLKTQEGQSLDKLRFKNPNGCKHCVQGEKDRTSVIEMLVLDDEDRRYIIDKNWLGWSEALKAKGYKDVTNHANLKILRGEIDLFTASERVLGLMPKPSQEVYKSFF